MVKRPDKSEMRSKAEDFSCKYKTCLRSKKSIKQDFLSYRFIMNDLQVFLVNARDQKPPARDDKWSAGLTLYAPISFKVPKHEGVGIDVGVAVLMPDDTCGRVVGHEFLLRRGLIINAKLLDSNP